uniref:GDP-D-glucose phosphorylase 1 n=1 Tax=Strigamia maritima TaxID=126957 RepID=T1JLX4_STRMM
MSGQSQTSVCSYTENDFYLTVPRWRDGAQVNLRGFQAGTAFDSQLQLGWNEAKRKGCFRYDLDNLDTRILAGKFGFLAQLNINRAQQRRHPQTIQSLTQPFDHTQFNFTQIKQDEILFELRRSQMPSPNRHLVIINVSPLEYCNSLLVPSIDSLKPQILDASGLRLAIETVLLSASPSFRVGFNSLCAYASVNHYHFHIFYLNAPLYLETVSVAYIANDCYEVCDYAVPGFTFQLENGDIDRLVNAVMRVVVQLQSLLVAHNVFITRGAAFGEFNPISYSTVRVFLWPREPADDDKDKTAFNVACCEISGHLPVKEEAAFHSLCEGQVVDALRKACEQTYHNVRAKIFNC